MTSEVALARVSVPEANAHGMTEPEVRVPRALDATAKAAIIVRLLLNEGADLPLEDLPDDLQARLTSRMGTMGLVDRVTLDAVIAEFADALSGIGLSFPNGLANALNALDGKISRQTAARLRKEAGVRQAGDPWDRLRSMSAADLARLAETESTEVSAVLLSKLDTGKAAELLGHLSGPLARRITYAVSKTGDVSPEAVDRIGLSLAAQLDEKPVPAFVQPPEKRVGEILNSSTASTRDEVLTALDDTDADFADGVRKSIFTFELLPVRLPSRAVPTVTRGVEADILMTALAGARSEGDRAAAEFLLSNMPTRLADSLREEMAEAGDIRQSDAERAMAAVITQVREMEDAGDLSLIAPDEGAAEAA